MKEINWKHNINDEIKDDKRELIIIDRIFIEKGNIQPNNILAKYNEKWYKYKCLKCGNEDWIREGDLDRKNEGRGCNACCNPPQKVVLGINTIWDKARWMVDTFGVSEQDAKTHTPCSDDKVKVKCPHCGNTKEIIIRNLYYREKIGCICGDGISYPEKIMYSLLKQLEIKFIHHKTFNWSQNKEYDFYLPDYNTIIETHGKQHYELGFRKLGKTLELEQENDKLKKMLALNNNIKHYIVIDCRESMLSWIKSNILKSKLNELFDLSQINWNECGEFAMNNLVKTACNYKNENPDLTTRDIGNLMGYNRKTIKEWLIKGDELGWCHYNKQEEHDRKNYKLSKMSKEKCSKKVEVFKDGVSYGVFNSVKELERKSLEQFGVRFTNISAICLGKRKHNHGYTFKYVEE